MPAWLRAGNPSQCGTSPRASEGNFVARPQRGLFCDADVVARALGDNSCVVIDARSARRFRGQDPEPRPGLRPGHMPGAANLPFDTVLSQGHLLTSAELMQIFAAKAKENQKIIFSCGSGVTACILALAASASGHEAISVYDGSWSEWGLGVAHE